MSLILKIGLLALASLAISLSLSSAGKTQYFDYLIFNSTFQLINDISSDLQTLLRYFNGTAMVAFFRIPLAALGTGGTAVFPNNLALYLKDLN